MATKKGNDSKKANNSRTTSGVVFHPVDLSKIEFVNRPTTQPTKRGKKK